MRPGDARQALRAAYSSLGWIVPTELSKCPPSCEVYYDVVAQIEVPQWSRDRVTSLGDACQAVSLLGGQDASLAVAGAHVLAAQLGSAASIDAALARYQQLWKPVITDKQRMARRGAAWFLPSSTAQLWLRRIVLTPAALPGVDRHVATALVGKAGPTLDKLSRSPAVLVQ